jgi:hypothetical protein
MKIEFDIPDAIALEAIEVYARNVKSEIARRNPGNTIKIPGADIEIVQKTLSEQIVQVYKRHVQVQAIKDIDDKINGNNIPR